jgi:hypothetical protein
MLSLQPAGGSWAGKCIRTVFNRGERAMKFKKITGKKENGHIMGGFIVTV